MELVEAIESRRSIRGYKPDPIPKQVLSDLLQIAVRAPSALNMQPWKFIVVAGEALERLKRASMEKFESGETPHPEMPLPTPAGVYRERQVALAVQLFQALGIAREDKEKRNEWMKTGIRFFDAPAAIIISVDNELSSGLSLLDVGSVSQTIALTALIYGLGTCIEDQGVFYPEVVREVTGIPESQRIIISMSIGYPDWDFPTNKVETGREPAESCTTWCGT